MRLEDRGEGDGGGGFDDEFHALPDEAHGGAYFVVGYANNLGDVLLDDGEIALAEGGEKPVGDSVGVDRRNDSSGFEGAERVVGAFGFAGVDFGGRPEIVRSEGGSGEEPAAADRGHDGVEIGIVVEQFEGGGGLAGDDAVVVVGMNEYGAGFFHDLAGGAFTGFEVGFAEGNFGVVSGDGVFFDLGCVGRHDDSRRDSAKGGGEGEGLGVVAGGVGDDAAGGFVVGEGEDGVAGAAEFEGADALEVLAFEVEFGASHGVEGAGGHDGGAMGVGGDAFCGVADGLEIGDGFGCGGH